MTGEAVLIAAFSARALAASAKRAGYLPLVVDCFGDLDTGEFAYASRCLPARVQTGFIARPLIAALDELIAEAPRPPIGLVLGSGFECNPRLVTRLAARYRLIGNGPEVIERTKNPASFFAALDKLGIRHPETRLTPPEETAGWLMKRIGGSGGLHIVDCPAAPRPDPRRYFQRKARGEAISLLGVIAKRGCAFAASRQWTSPLARRPYRYGGAAGSLVLEPDLEARLIEACLTLSHEIDLVGLVSFDFLVAYGDAQLLEVNPRPGATLDVFDDGAGSMFHAHVEAAGGGDSATYLKDSWRPPVARASAFLYADQGVVNVTSFEWPRWAFDRPKAGTVVAKHQPLATVIADGSDPHTAEILCHERLGVLADMLYEGKKEQGSARL